MLLAEAPSIGFVIALGMGTVFVGLICIIIMCGIMSAILNVGKKSETAEKPAQATPAAPVAPVQTPIANKQEFIAAVSAAIAEDMGTDVTGIRVLSVKKL